MFDTEDTEPWHKYVRVKATVTRYAGTYLTASQWAYLAHNGDHYALILVQTWFKKTTVTPVGVINIADWDLPAGTWVSVGEQNWYRYEVDDEPQI